MIAYIDDFWFMLLLTLLVIPLLLLIRPPSAARPARRTRPPSWTSGDWRSSGLVTVSPVARLNAGAPDPRLPTRPRSSPPWAPPSVRYHRTA